MKRMNLIAAVLVALAASAHAQSNRAAPAASAAAAPASDAEVLKVDKAQGKLTLKHGPLANLDMPGMTMVFRVAAPGMLEGLKAGDKVKFTADRVNGAFTVTAIEIAK